jgi:hypothetical protein
MNIIKKSGNIFFSACFLALLLSGQTVQADDPPPMRSLLQLELEAEQLETIRPLVSETEANRRRLSDEYRTLCSQVQQEERARNQDEKRIRELKRLKVENREELRIEKAKFHRLVESQLSPEQVQKWHKLRSKNQKWCQDKWMRCDDCTCGKRNTKQKHPSPGQ